MDMDKEMDKEIQQELLLQYFMAGTWQKILSKTTQVATTLAIITANLSVLTIQQYCISQVALVLMGNYFH